MHNLLTVPLTVFSSNLMIQKKSDHDNLLWSTIKILVPLKDHLIQSGDFNNSFKTGNRW